MKKGLAVLVFDSEVKKYVYFTCDNEVLKISIMKAGYAASKERKAKQK
jgi:hypothetical protein